MIALPADNQAVIRPAMLCLALRCSEASLLKNIVAGHVPRPDARGQGNVKLWKRSTIRQWNPTIANAIDDLLAHPAFAPRPTYFAKAA